MAFEQGVFTSTSVTVNGDGIPVGNKAVSAAFLAREKYHLARGNGISLLPSSAFYVAPVSGLTARVSAGWGIMKGYSFCETTDYDITMTSSGSEQTLYIGVRLDATTGIFTGSHVAARTTFVAATDRVFAIIVIPASAVTLTAAMITDTRYNPAYCGTINEYDVTLQEMIENFYTNGLPGHASTHAAGAADAIAPSDIGAESSTLTTSTKTGSYTILASDNRAKISMNSSSSKTFTFATQAVGGYPDGMIVFLNRLGTGAVTIAGSAGVTFQSAGNRMKIAEQYAWVFVRKIATDAWEVVGSTSL